MRPLVNPGMPTQLGFAYYLPNLSTGKGSRIRRLSADDRQNDCYKDRYWKTLSNLDIQRFFIRQLLEQAERQVAAAGDRPIRWYFSERKVADFVRDLFEGDPIRGRIEIVHVPMPESAR
jgi:hypothetical protein